MDGISIWIINQKDFNMHLNPNVLELCCLPMLYQSPRLPYFRLQFPFQIFRLFFARKIRYWHLPWSLIFVNHLFLIVVILRCILLLALRSYSPKQGSAGFFMAIKLGYTEKFNFCTVVFDLSTFINFLAPSTVILFRFS